MLSTSGLPVLLAEFVSASRRSPLPSIDSGDLQLSLLSFAPELILCLGIVLLLVFRLVPFLDRKNLSIFGLLFALIALAVTICQWPAIARFDPNASPSLVHQLSRIAHFLGADGMVTPDVTAEHPVQIFGGMLVFDQFTLYLRGFLYAFAALLFLLSLTTGIPDSADSADYGVLVLGATLGMALMVMANHLLMMFIAIEMASLPSYALAGFLKNRRPSSEAALKYVVYGGGAAGVMLYGISLLAGKFGTGYLPELAVALVQSVAPVGRGIVLDPVVVLGVLFVLVGVAFKLAAVPFHFWCPDVFEGASAEVAGFLSVASKGAALALLVRVVYLLAGVAIGGTPMAMVLLPRDAPLPNPAWTASCAEVARYLIGALAFLAALTTTFGNMAAYYQNNLKRLLAYSTIAHAGYMLMGLAVLARLGVEAVLFYLAAYLLMNLGAFAVVAYLRNETGSEDLSDFRGLVRRSPFMVIVLSVFLLSLLGLPPLVGFTGKFLIFNALYTQAQTYGTHGERGLGTLLFGLLIVGGINTVLSAFYYLRVLRVMILDRRAEDLEGGEPPALAEPLAAKLYTGALAVAVIGFGLFWASLDSLSQEGARPFASTAEPVASAAPPRPAPRPPAPPRRRSPPREE
jgi:NADH-quinone oxidoreductase subunit N